MLSVDPTSELSEEYVKLASHKTGKFSIANVNRSYLSPNPKDLKKINLNFFDAAFSKMEACL